VEGEQLVASDAARVAVVGGSPTASGGAWLTFREPVTATITVDTPSGLSQLVLRARGEACEGDPTMQVAVDGTPVAETVVSSAGWRDYAAPVTAGAGSHQLAVTYANDLRSGCDRNLRVDFIALHASLAPPAPTTTPTPPPTATPDGSATPDPTDTPTPTPTPTNTPAATDPRSPLMTLARGNPFTTPLPDSVPLLPATQQESFGAELKYIVNAATTRVEQSQYSKALYIVYRNGDVHDTAGRKKASGVRFVKPTGPIKVINDGIDGRGWPIASWMKPDPGEGHLAIYNPERHVYAEMYAAKVGSGSVSYSSGGAIPDTSQSMGMSPPTNPWWGACAFGLNLMSFVITDYEMRTAIERYKAGDYARAYIPHIIGYKAYRHHPNQWTYPASKTDDMGKAVPQWGSGGNTNRLGNGRGIIPMGGIIRLDPNIDVQRQVRGDGTAFGDMMARIIARTYQRHGATMTDQTEAGFALIAEHVRRTDGSYDTGAVSYGSGAPWNYGTAWLKPMMHQIIDSDWLLWVNTGRNFETDTRGPAAAGAYRPPR